MLRLVLAALFACVSPLALAQGESAKTPADATAERPIAGKVVLIEGDVRVYDRNQALRRPKLDDSLGAPRGGGERPKRAREKARGAPQEGF